jgi:hypothetical protein
LRIKIILSFVALVVCVSAIQEQKKYYLTRSDEEVQKQDIHDDDYYIATFDQEGRVVREEYFSKNNKPSLDREEIHLYLYQYDKAGNRTSMEFLGTKGEAISNYEGVHRYEWIYDTHGKVVAMKCYNKEGTLKKQTDLELPPELLDNN